LGKLPWLAWTYVAATAAAGALVIFLGLAYRMSWLTLGVLVVLFVVCESMPTALSPRRASWAPSSAATLASVVLLGPVAGAMVGASVLLSVRRLMPVQRVFNAGMYALAGFAAGQAFLAFGGHPGLPSSKSFPHIIGPFAAAASAEVIVNYLLIGGVLWLTRQVGQQRGRGALRTAATPLLSSLGYAAFGLLIAALWRLVGPFSAVLVLLPLLVARWAVAQYVDQQLAYEATMAALCQAVETKDLYTRGHSERVSRASAMIAEQIGMRAERIEAIRYAGMLHDIGKLGVPTKVLQKDGSLTEEEFAAIQLHPMRGLEIVREIGFLDEALAGIMHHHERIDGRGYPLGLAGDEIPEFARVIGVADAFDSMTSTRSYRGARSVEEAVQELRKWSGTQFDPAIVEAFLAALSREGWQPPAPVEPPPWLPTGTMMQDHDDPTAPLRVVERRLLGAYLELR
jgi:putative nucleotidyltransferase with HDIG domain